jgi:hypothetical protein
MSTDPLRLTNERIHVKMGVVWCCFDDSDDYYLNLEPGEGWRHFADCYLTNCGWCVVYQYPIIRTSSYSTTIEEFNETITTYLNGKCGTSETRVYWPSRDEKKQIRTEFARISSVLTQS